MCVFGKEHFIFVAVALGDLLTSNGHYCRLDQNKIQGTKQIINAYGGKMLWELTKEFSGGYDFQFPGDI